MQELDENKMFQGLGLRGWLRLVFTTRAMMIREHDRITNLLLDKNAEASERANRAASAMQKMSATLVKQHETLCAIGEEMNESPLLHNNLGPELRKRITDSLDAARAGV